MDMHHLQALIDKLILFVIIIVLMKYYEHELIGDASIIKLKIIFLLEIKFKY